MLNKSYCITQSRSVRQRDSERPRVKQTDRQKERESEGERKRGEGYLDDKLVHSQFFDEHIRHIQTVLRQYQQHCIKLTSKKCEQFRAKVRFLGRMVSKDGYTMQRWLLSRP